MTCSLHPAVTSGCCACSPGRPVWREQAAASDAQVLAREGSGLDVRLSRCAARQRPRLFAFRLYGAVLRAHAGRIEAHHAYRLGGLSQTDMASAPDQPADAVLDGITRPHWRMMGVHRRTARAPEPVRRAFAAAWCRFGPVASVQEGLALPGPPAG